jgi:hypothetical protein
MTYLTWTPCLRDNLVVLDPWGSQADMWIPVDPIDQPTLTVDFVNDDVSRPIADIIGRL